MDRPTDDTRPDAPGEPDAPDTLGWLAPPSPQMPVTPALPDLWAPAAPDGPPAEWWSEPRSEGDASGPDAGAQWRDESFAYGTRVERFRPPPWFLRAWVMLFVVTALAGGLRFWHLTDPRAVVFDEVYYAKDGCVDAGIAYQQCGRTSDGEQTVTVHPPLGRELIALGERLFTRPGDFRCDEKHGLPSATCNPFGWRFAPAVAGTLSVLLLAILAWKLFDSVLWGYAAGVLLATESLNLVQSRMSMLDIFIALFVVAGFLFIVLDRRWIDRRTPVPVDRSNTDILLDMPPDPVPSPVWRPWRLAAGVAFGLAAATKWSGATALIGAVLLTWIWERTRRKRAGYRFPTWEAFKDEAFGIFVFLLLIPVIVYVGSYVRWFTQNDWNVGAWMHLQRGMADFSLNLRTGHPYASPAWKWILMIRPVAYYFQCPKKVGTNCITAQAIVGMGNPFVFWASLIALPYAAVAWFAKRDWRAGLVFVAVALQYFPWFLAKRTSFFFYMTPITPFLVLALVYALRDLASVRVGVEERASLAPAAWVAIFLSVALFAFFWPVLTGTVTSWNAWHIRMWLPSWV